MWYRKEKKEKIYVCIGDEHKIAMLADDADKQKLGEGFDPIEFGPRGQVVIHQLAVSLAKLLR